MAEAGAATQIIKVQIAADAASQDKGLLTKAAESGKKLMGDLEKC